MIVSIGTFRVLTLTKFIFDEFCLIRLILLILKLRPIRAVDLRVQALRFSRVLKNFKTYALTRSTSEKTFAR